MEDTSKSIETLLERTTEYVKTSLELFKLKSVYKTSDVVSSMLPGTVFVFLVILFILFLSFGLAYYLGNILGGISFGFLIVAGFYGLIGIVLHFLMHNWIKSHIRNYIHKQLLK
jgi:hypothetical protein